MGSATNGARLLGAVGRPSAVDALLGTLPPRCAVTGNAETTHDFPEAVRAVVANALGYIADARAVAPLCACALKSKNPGDMFPIAEALGRIGGAAAVKCLAKIITRAEYSPDIVSREFVLEPRWEAARFGIHAATPGDVGKIESAIAKASTDRKVRKKMEPWQAGIDAIHECADDAGCWKSKLEDSGAAWIVREKAALELARRNPGDPATALAIANAFSVRSPDARVTMAWPAAAILGHGEVRCGACADSLQAQLDDARRRLPAEYQLSVLVARYTIAKLRQP